MDRPVNNLLQEVLTAALASEWTPKQALILERTDNVESVVDAVQRVASHLPQVRDLSSGLPWAGQNAPFSFLYIVLSAIALAMQSCLQSLSLCTAFSCSVTVWTCFSYPLSQVPDRVDISGGAFMQWLVSHEVL